MAVSVGVLPEDVRLDAGRRDRHGGDGEIPTLLNRGAAGGRHDDEAPGDPTAILGLYFNVPALDAAMERVKSAGGAVIMGPQEVPGPMYIIQCTDPQGAYFALVSMKR